MVRQQVLVLPSEVRFLPAQQKSILLTTPQQSEGDYRALVLAAGKGTRMKSELPKVVMPLGGKPMLLHVIESLIRANIHRLYIVVGYKKEEIIKSVEQAAIPSNCTVEYVEQSEQLGTGHAVLTAESSLRDMEGSLLVTNGDMPLLRPETFTDLLRTHLQGNHDATVLTARLDNPSGYGRIRRNGSGRLLDIVEEKDADPETLKLNEINTGTYVFRIPAIFEYIRRIGTDNAQGEYYLPDIIRVLNRENKTSGSFLLKDPDEGLGANSPEELELLEDRFKVRT